MKKIISFLSVITISFKGFSEDNHSHEIKKHKPSMNFGSVIFDRLEYLEKDRSIGYKITSYYGEDYNKLWFELEGRDYLKDGKGEIEIANLLFSKAISSFWDFRFGLGYAGNYRKGIKSIVLGIKGVAPFWFKIDTNVYLTEKGETYLRLNAENSLLMNQKLILQPHFETTFSNRKIRNLDLGSGLSKLSFSLRLGYQIKREFEPYIGISFERFFGQTKYLRQKNKETNGLIGIKMWF